MENNSKEVKVDCVKCGNTFTYREGKTLQITSGGCKYIECPNCGLRHYTRG